MPANSTRWQPSTSGASVPSPARTSLTVTRRLGRFRPARRRSATSSATSPARDHILVERLREKGAIIFAKAVCTEYNGRAGNPGGRHKPDKVLPSTLGYQRSSWGGNPANVYDTR